MLNATRLTYRINRFEVRAMLTATAASVAVTAIVMSWIRSSGYAQCLGDVQMSTVCFEQEDIRRWATRVAGMSLQLAGAFPLLAGLLLGVPLISRELDKGTARLAWSLAPSRGRWYVQRVMPILLLVGLTALTIGLLAEQLTALFNPGIDLSNSFVTFRGRGVLLATSAMLVGSVGVAVGAVIGRQIPTLVLALLLGGLTLLAIGEVDRKVLASEAVPLIGENYYTHDLTMGEGRFQLPDGRLVTWDELVVIEPSAMNGEFNHPFIEFGIPRNRYQEIVAREGVVQVVLSLGFLAVGAVVVGRRRPG
ncbi:MAG TPA: hypothetical protein VM427_10470 [Patescibacteria group bacterium]|nr:hypothetical protein [Patescibacteria group bacterium]